MSDRDTRQAQLEALDWNEVKAIAQNLDIEKPKQGTWQDTIPWILEKEGFGQLPPESQQLADAAQQPEFTTMSDPVTPDPKAQPVYPTTFYQALNLPTCPSCNEKRRTGLQGELICPASRLKDQCPILKSANAV